MGHGSFTPVADDSCAVLGRLAALLAEGRPLPEGLRMLASALELRSVVVRSLTGEVIGVGGEALQAVSAIRAVDDADVWLEFPVVGHEGSPLATLTVQDGRPSQMPTLRAASAILGLALSAHRDPAASAAQLVDDAERHLDGIADAVHDGPLQSLMVARYAVDAAVRGGDPGAVRDAIQQAVVELRQLVWSMRPRGAGGLSPALQQLSTSLVKADSPPLELSLDDTDLHGPMALLAYRLVQAVLGRAEGPVRVALSGSVLDIAGAALPTPHQWIRRAAALDCVLSTNGDHTHLVLAAAPVSSFSNEVRTSS